MELYKIYAYSVVPQIETFLGDFTELPSAKAVIKGFNDTQYEIISNYKAFAAAKTFKELPNVGNIKVLTRIIGDTKHNPGKLQF